MTPSLFKDAETLVVDHLPPTDDTTFLIYPFSFPGEGVPGWFSMKHATAAHFIGGDFCLPFLCA
jgi:hypothetical protein